MMKTNAKNKICTGGNNRMKTTNGLNQTVKQWLDDYNAIYGDDEVKTVGTKIRDTGGGDFKKVSQGTHMAACNMVVDLGNQNTEYMGQSKVVHQIYIRWEVPSERIEFEVDGQKKEGPLCIGKTYTASLSEKANLRKDLQGWRNRAFTEQELQGFDIEKVLGTCCQVIVSHKESNGNTYANVTGVAGWPNGVDRIKPENDPIYYDNQNTGKYEQLPKWIKEKLDGQQQSPGEMNHLETPEDFDPDSDIPF